MDLDYLFCLLETKMYYVNRKCHFEDKEEVALPLNSLFGFGLPEKTDISKEIVNEKSEEISSKIEQYRESAYWLTSCWTKNQRESLLMWKYYTTKCGARIKSSIHNVIASIGIDTYNIVCGNIAYNGYYAKPFEECLFSKEPAYTDEQEVRFYFIPKVFSTDKSTAGIQIPVSPSVMIDEITLSPYMQRSATKKIADFIMNVYNIKNVHSSSIKIS